MEGKFACSKLITSKKGGFGVIATGRGIYKDKNKVKNPDAVRLSYRHAYIEAYMEAKKELAVDMHGLSTEAKTTLYEGVSQLVKDDETLINTGGSREEITSQYIEALIEGYEIYSVKDIPSEHSICITLSSNGKNLGRHARPTPAIINAADLKIGLNQVFDEINKGVTLMAGGRTIMTEQGDLCFVGYGSALISDDDDPGMRAILANNARKIAMARARDSLLEMMKGDKMSWEFGTCEKYSSMMEDFEEVSGNDETVVSPEKIKKFEQRKEYALSQLQTTETTQSLRKGVLPPGTKTETFRDKDNAWYYAVAVYHPVLTQATSDFADEIKNATLIQPIRSPQRSNTGSNNNSSLKSSVSRPSQEIRMIPTGSFESDDE